MVNKTKQNIFSCVNMWEENSEQEQVQNSLEILNMHRGKYIPEIIAREDVEKITLLPTEIKEKFVKDIKNM